MARKRATKSEVDETGIPEEPTETAGEAGEIVPDSDSKTAPKKKKKGDVKTDIQGFVGGVDINLKAKDEDGVTLESRLSAHILELLEAELKNQKTLTQNIRRAEKQYAGKKRAKAFPWVGCFDDRTEVMTEFGWMPVSEVRIGHALYSVNPETHIAEYVPVVALTQHFESKMVRLKSKSVDLLVTKDHKMAIQKTSNGKISFCDAQELLPNEKNRHTGDRIPLTSKWGKDESEEEFGLPINEVMEFIGWYISEGWTIKHGPLRSKYSSICIAQTKDEGRERIKYLLRILCFDYKETRWGFIVHSRTVPWRLRELLGNMGVSHNKTIPHWLMHAHGPKSLRHLLNGLIGGDGHVRKRDDKNYDNATYYTSSKQLADEVQELAQMIGLRARISRRSMIEQQGGMIRGGRCKSTRDGYEVSINVKDQAKISSLSISETSYFGVVYCFTLERYHTVYVRRNGIPSWCGQCSNLSIPETRANVDAFEVRVTDAIFNRRKPIILRALKPEMASTVRKLEDALDWYLKHIIKFKEKLVSPLKQALKSGTGILFTDWVSQKKVIYRYAKPEEIQDKTVVKYKTDGDPVVKEVQSVYEGPQLFGVSREDFVISSDADKIDDALLVGFRKYYRQAQIAAKEKQKLFRKGTAKKLASSMDKYDEVKEGRADNQGKELRPPTYGEPLEIWTVWTQYDVDDDGEEDSIVVSIHRDSGVICRAIYNPVFTSTKPFVRLVGTPIEYSFDGEGLCNMMYHIQEAIDAAVNQRMDRGTLLNTVVALVRAGCGKEMADFKFQPGKVYEVEEGTLDEALKIVPVPPVPPSAFQEEGNLRQLGQRVTGNTPELQGISSSDRPVAKDTFARLEESNKKFKSFIDFIRDGIVECVYMILELYSQYQPILTYKTQGADQEWVNQTVAIPAMSIREGIGVELAAATEILSAEMRKEVGMNAFMLVRQFQTDLLGMAQMIASPNVPSDIKSVIIMGSLISQKLLTDILKDLDLIDAEGLVLNLTKTMDIPRMIANSPDLQPPPPPMGGPGGPMAGGPGGPPGGGPPPGHGAPPPGQGPMKPPVPMQRPPSGGPPWFPQGNPPIPPGIPKK